MDHGTSCNLPVLFRSTDVSSSLTELNLVACEITQQSFSKLLSMPRALKRLTFGGKRDELANQYNMERGEPLYVDGIYKQQASLEYLDFELPAIQYYKRRYTEDPHGIAAAEVLDLGRFPTLRELRTDADFLPDEYAYVNGVVHLARIPPTLHTLHVRTDVALPDDTLAKLLRKAPAGWAGSTQLRNYALLCKSSQLCGCGGEPCDDPECEDSECEDSEPCELCRDPQLRRDLCAEEVDLEDFVAEGIHFRHLLNLEQAGPDPPFECHCWGKCYHAGGEDYYDELEAGLDSLYV